MSLKLLFDRENEEREQEQEEWKRRVSQVATMEKQQMMISRTELMHLHLRFAV